MGTPNRSVRGFTMIEVLAVMAILGILAAAILPLGETLLISRKERELRTALAEIRNALDEYKRAVDRGFIAPGATSSGYPANLQMLVDGVPDMRPEARGRPLYFLRSLPRDPFASASVSAENSWKLRSYASPPSRPEPGLDVFDIRSTSNATALDGSRYDQW